MNKRNRAILLGLTIGDGHIMKFQKTHQKGTDKPFYATLMINHSAKQKDYIEHKAELLHSILGGKKPKLNFFKNNGFPAYRIQKNNKYFRVLHSWLYSSGVKVVSRRILNMLTPEAIALWYMDDGNLSAKKRNGKTHAYELFINTGENRENNQVIIDYFKEVHAISFGQVKNNGTYRLRCGTKEARKFIKLIEKHIIPSMKYKIEMK